MTVRAGPDTESFTSDWVINAAGLVSDQVAALAGIDVDAAGYRLHHCKGSYFSVAPARRAWFRASSIPVPGHVSLGVHAVVGLEGRLRFGPDVEYLPDRRPDYAVPGTRARAFRRGGATAGARDRRRRPHAGHERDPGQAAGARPGLP